ncbi:MAG: hypothetical protein ACR2PR_02395 [Pseudohongiellaceae bacterium]
MSRMILVLLLPCLALAACKSTLETATPADALENFSRNPAISARDTVLPAIDDVLDKVYEPVYKAIPEYADFHYSVLGGYTELTWVIKGRMSEGLEEKLFDGFEKRMSEGISSFDRQYVDAYKLALEKQVSSLLQENTLSREEIQEAQEGAIAKEENTITVEGAYRRALETVIISSPQDDGISESLLKRIIQALLNVFTKSPPSPAASSGGGGASDAVIDKIVKKIDALTAKKFGIKATQKVSSAWAGMITGAATCSWSGPGAVICGLGGATIAWIIVDAAIVNLDEYFNRDEFEAELKTIINEDYDQKKQAIEAVLEEKTQAIYEVAEEPASHNQQQVEDFNNAHQ